MTNNSHHTKAELDGLSLDERLEQLESLLMDLRAELRFVGLSEHHPLTERLVKLIQQFKQRQHSHR